MDPEDGCRLARPARPISLSGYLPSLLPGVATQRNLEQTLTHLVEYLQERGKLDLSECFIDGTFGPQKRGAEGGKDLNAPMSLREAGQRYENHRSGRQRQGHLGPMHPERIKAYDQKFLRSREYTMD